MKHFDLIESYLQGAMSKEDAHAFDQQLASDPELRKDLEDYKLARLVSGTLAYDDAKRKISGLQEKGLQVVHRRKATPLLLRIAAVLLVLVVCGFMFSQFSYTDSALAGSHFLTASLQMRSPQSAGIAKLIDEKKYTEAIDVLQQENANDPLSKSLLAEALTKAKRFPEAISLYSELAADTQFINRDGAEFALALLYLKNNEPAKADTLIARIASNEEHDYRFEARKLQAQRKSFWRKLVL